MAFAIDNDEEYDFEIAGDAFAPPVTLIPASPAYSDSAFDASPRTNTPEVTTNALPARPRDPIGGTSGAFGRVVGLGDIMLHAANNIATRRGPLESRRRISPPAVQTTPDSSTRVTESPPPAEVDDARSISDVQSPAQHSAFIPRQGSSDVANNTPSTSIAMPTQTTATTQQQPQLSAPAPIAAWPYTGTALSTRALQLEELRRRLREARSEPSPGSSIVPPGLESHPAVRSALLRYEATLAAAEAAHARLEATLYARLETASRMAAAAASRGGGRSGRTGRGPHSGESQSWRRFTDPRSSRDDVVEPSAYASVRVPSR